MIPHEKATIALVGTGGTIASVGRHSLELAEYIDNKTLYTVHELLEQFPEVRRVANIRPLAYASVISPAIGPVHWLELHRDLHQFAKENPDLDGIVITHGTATLEETAYFLNLTLKIKQPVIITGAQRPATALSTDGAMNLVNAVRVAGSPGARGLGVLVVLNDEVQAAREVSKTSTFRLQTFRTPDFGVLGQADPDRVVFYRRPVRKHAPDTEFDVSTMRDLPRVDIVYSYAGADGAAVDAALAAGAKGIVVAGFASGLVTPAQLAALRSAQEQGVAVVHGSRVGSGRVIRAASMHAPDSIAADNLSPQKARILLMLALTISQDNKEIQRLFETY